MELLKRPKYVDRTHYLNCCRKKKLFGQAKNQDICYSPTPLTVIGHTLDYIRWFRGEKLTLVEVGCGDGRWLIEAARRYQRISCIGYEMHPERARLARSLAARYKVADRVKIYSLNYKEHKAPKGDYLIMYLYPKVNEKVTKWFAKTNKSFNVLSVAYQLFRPWTMGSQASMQPKNLHVQELDVISMSAWHGFDVFRYHVKRGSGKK